MADALAASTPPVPRSPTQAPSVPAPPAVDALPTTTTTTAAPSTSVPSPSPAPSATPVPLPDNPFDNPASEAARAALQASRWNGLLRWGRAARLGGHGGAPAGWDFARGMYHVPRDSPEWTAGVERAQIDPSSGPAPILTLQSSSTLSHLNPDAALSDDELGGAGGGGAGGGGGGGGAMLTESGRPKRRAVR